MTRPTLTPVAHDLFVADVRAVARSVRASGWLPDFLVAIGRGGLVPGAYLSHALDVPLLSVDYSAGVPWFGSDLLARVAEKSRAGRRLLIVDDINDSGRTLGLLRDALEDGGAVPGNIRVAVLIANIRSPQPIDYHAREIDRDVVKDWFVFPWEAMADESVLIEDAEAVPERLGLA